MLDPENFTQEEIDRYRERYEGRGLKLLKEFLEEGLESLVIKG